MPFAPDFSSWLLGVFFRLALLGAGAGVACGGGVVVDVVIVTSLCWLG